MQEKIAVAFLTLLLFAACNERPTEQAAQPSTVSAQQSQTEQASSAQLQEEPSDPPAPEASSFRTILLTDGAMVLPEEEYLLEGEELEAFQELLMPSQWREPVDYQPTQREFFSPCVIVTGEQSAMYISPAHQEKVFDETLIFIKYGDQRQYSAVYFAPGEVAQQAEAFRAGLNSGRPE